MSKLDGRSRSMNAFADVHGEPDVETTARMRERLAQTMRAQDDRKRRRRDRLHGVLAATVVLAVAGGVAWQQGWLAGAGGPADVRPGVLRTAEVAQRVEREWGALVIGPRSLVRLSDGDGSPVGEDELELVDGEVEVAVAVAGARAVLVRVGAHTVRVVAGRVAVQRTPGVPLVTVHEGRAELRGPDLPADGVRLGPAP
jgi:ferric-dicitrate binding protein FerR (iron transport regulator)